MMFRFLLPLLVLFQIKSVNSCIRFFDDCCSDYIPHQLPEKTRFDDPDILYMTPKMTTNSDCSKVTVDCTFSGMPSDIYNLVFTDKDDKVLKVVESNSSIFNLDCDTGTENYISCELGCNVDKCSSDKNCAKCDLPSVLAYDWQSRGPSKYSYTKMFVDGCLQNELTCELTPNFPVLCPEITLKIIAQLQDGTTRSSVILAEGLSKIKTTVKCGESGGYEYSNLPLVYLSCNIANCNV